MTIIKPIYVYKWVNKKENKKDYIEYVFDTNESNNYNKSVNVIKENIYQDSSKEDAINKIAYYINRINDKNIAVDVKNLYYTWINNEPFLYDIETITWKGYNVNPFKSSDRQSDEINETIKIYYNKSKELFETTDIINIVFKSDFDYNNQYYYDNLRFKSNNYKIDSDNKLEELYKLNIINNKKMSENYYKVVFSAQGWPNISNLPSLIIIFDKLLANSKIQLIQYINNYNKAYYKLYKKHNFKKKKELSKIFKLNKDKDSNETINLYYSKNIIITIFVNGIINLTFDYAIDKGIIINDILKYVEELNTYINKILNININFKENNINARIIFNAYKTKYADLIKEINISTIFTEIKDKDGEYYYKRTPNYKDRSIIDKNIKDDLDNNKIRDRNNQDGDIQDTRIIVKKKKESREYMIDVKNVKTFFEFECLEFWISKIIEYAIDDKQSSKDITNNIQESPPDMRNQKNATTSSESSGGNNNDNKKYLINKLKNADMELWGDDNKSRKCQKTHQPLPLSVEEYNKLKSNGLNKLFDNSIIHNKNYYTCPRLWCPISNVPLDEGDPNAKCPIVNEKPLRLNDDMLNTNLPRYVYLKKKYNIPCCGKKFNNDANKEKDDDIDDIIKPVNKPIKPLEKANKDNYIFSTIENWTPYNRYGVIPIGLYKILYPNTYKENSIECIKNKKKNCIFTKGLINIEETPEKYDNIINTIAYLVGETKETFIETIKNKLDILTYISLDNGNTCKNFGDYEPVLYEYNKELYSDLKKHLHNINKKHKIYIKLPKFNSKKEKNIFKISRLLYIYKSYNKFIKYISADNYPDDKGIQYLYSLIALVYKKLLIVWEYTITNPVNISSIDLLAPNYINDIISYYDLNKKTEIIMVLKKILKEKKEDKLYEKFKYRDNIYFYEPLIIRTTNEAENKRILLSEYPNIKKIINLKPNNNNIFNNLNSIINIIQNENKMYMINTIIINDNYTIDKIMLKNNILIRFNPQGTIILPYLIKELNIKNIVFLDDIIDKKYNITIIKKDLEKTHSNFLKKINKLKHLGITVDIGVNNFQDDQIIKNILTIRKEDSNYKGNIILFGKKNEFEVYNNKNSNVINKWLDLRLQVKNKLVILLETKNKIAEYSKKSRIEFIKYLLEMFDTDKTKIQIILEEIPVFTIKGITDWYANTLLYTKYDYINNLSDNFVDDGEELKFTQYLIKKKKIPNDILYYHEATPNIIYDDSENISINYNNIYDNDNIVVNSSKSSNEKIAANVSIKIPKMFEGEEKDLNAKWTKYKKRVWPQLKYIKNDYTPINIIELFNYLKTFNNDIVNDYNDIITKTFYTYKIKLNKNINEHPNDIKDIKDIFKDPYFYYAYLNSMNSVNNTKKTFKTVKIFLTTYFYNSTTTERNKILNNIRTSDTYTYYPNEITFYIISKILNISIFIIHNRAEYGKAANIKKRADDKDLSITSTIYKADNNAQNRPLLMLYRKTDKTHLSYYIIRNINHENFIYSELNDLKEDNEIRIMIEEKETTNTYSSSSSTQSINI